jgi:hypothetical protein
MDVRTVIELAGLAVILVNAFLAYSAKASAAATTTAIAQLETRLAEKETARVKEQAKRCQDCETRFVLRNQGRPLHA